MSPSPSPDPSNQSVRNVIWHSHSGSSVALSARRDLLTTALNRDENNISLRRALVDLHCEMGCHEEAIECVGTQPQDPELQYLLGKALLAIGKHESAEEALRNASESGLALARIELAEALDNLGRYSEAADICDEAIRSNPDSITALRLLGHQLLRLRDGQALRQLCERSAGSARLSTLRRTFEIAASQLLGEVSEQELTAMHQAEIQLSSLTREAWWKDQTCAELACELAEHPNSMNVAHRQSTNKGTRVAEIQAGQTSAISMLAEAIRRQVETYLETRPPLWFEAKGETKGKALALNMWAVLLDDGGYQDWHMHPSALISGVFYVDAPEPQQGGDDKDGYLEFGTANNRYFGKDEWTYPIRPTNGSLVLFPSAFVHRTLPHRGDQPRISIAFDVVPVG